ncbi:FkbM family methyltransferase [Gammaproteobacteria bacterium]|nr:FkbM family methyltransferase [Gammaproteobacteria bacterium]
MINSLLNLILILPRGGYFLLKLLSTIIPSLRSYDLHLKSANNIKISVDLSESVFFPLIKYGYYPPQVTEDFIIKCIVSPDETVLDVGANIGWMSLIFAECVGPNGSVYAFEPSSKIYDYLGQIANQKHQIIAIRKAVSNTNDPVIFENEVASNLSHITKNPSRNGELVECVTLDEFVSTNSIPRVDFIKVDAEGHDVEVIEGAIETLNQHRPILMFEALAPSELNSIVSLLDKKMTTFRIVNQYPFSAINDFNATNNYLSVPQNLLCKIPKFLRNHGFLSLINKV